jgi:hypothetical protein
VRIAFLGNFAVPYSSENHHKLSLEALGHTVSSLQEGRASGGGVLAEACAADIFVWVHTHGWETPGYSMIRVLDELKAKGIPTVTYHLDLWLGLARQKDVEADSFYRHIEHFFTVDKLMADWFNENTTVKGHYLPAGVYDGECEMLRPSTLSEVSLMPDGSFDVGLDRKYPIVFVGSRRYHPEYPYRGKLIDWLKRHYGDNFQHVGPDGKIPTTRGKALNQLYADSKIAIGDTLCKGFNYPYYVSDRLMESTGRGAFTIFPYIKGIEELFEIDKEIVTYEFENFAELRRKIDYYLSHDDEREAIRRAGHERTKRDHTYLKRWETILATVGQS